MKSESGRSAGVEALEARRMLSAVVKDHVLVVDGTRSSDIIVVWDDSAKSVRVTVNGDLGTSFLKKSFGKIKIRGGLGNDVITIQPGIAKRAQVLGGGGNDTLHGGDARDTLLGEAGDDNLIGEGGDDTLRGGAGDDRADGGDGDDVITGDGNSDTLLGGDGDDTLSGGRGDDTLYEDAGTDRIRGNRGKDRFIFADSARDVRDEGEDETVEAMLFVTAATPVGAVLTIANAGVTGSLVKLGSGTLTLGGMNTVTGGTTVSEGTLSLAGAATGTLTLGNSGVTNMGGGSVVINSGSGSAGSLPGSGVIVTGTFTPITTGGGLGEIVGNGADAFTVPAGTVVAGPGQDDTGHALAAGEMVTISGGWTVTTPSGFKLTIGSLTTTPFTVTARTEDSSGGGGGGGVGGDSGGVDATPTTPADPGVTGTGDDEGGGVVTDPEPTGV